MKKLSTRFKEMTDKVRIKLLHILRAMNVGGIETLVEALLRNHDRGKFELRVCVLTEGGGRQSAVLKTLRTFPSTDVFTPPQLERVFSKNLKAIFVLPNPML